MLVAELRISYEVGHTAVLNTEPRAVQDIYGLEQSHAPREDLTEEENEDRLCVICLVNERNTTVLPCRHMCMCDECAQELRKQTHKCPICRIHVRSRPATGVIEPFAEIASL